MPHTYYSNGKLLITGEYLVLNGADAFALPTKFGQNLVVENSINKEITWKSYNSDTSLWFDAVLSFEEIISNNCSGNDLVKSTLITILHEAYLLNPDFLNSSQGFRIATHLTFPKNWGLGTSSTLLNNIAQWLQIDAFTLLKNSFGGSGYDIACAQHNTPIIYRLEQEKPIVKTTVFNPAFTKNVYFVYLNKKQSSKAAIEAYYANKNNKTEQYIADNNKITEEVITASSLAQFMHALEQHELHLSRILKIKTIKETAFPDFNGTVKSLGAWGGDFIMAVSSQNPKSYFASKGYETVLSYSEMILT
jgi:mevalonate kinase